MMLRTSLCAGLAMTVACAQSTSPPESTAPMPASAPAPQPASSPASQPASGPSPSQPGASRAAEGRARLARTEAGRTVLAAIEAHGGLTRWFEGGALTFTYDYQPVKGARRSSRQTVDLVSSRAYHDISAPVRGRIGFDGRTAWHALEEGESYPARFWALTPYYFVGMPFVLSDPGVHLALSEDDPGRAGFPKDTRVVRVTFAPGTGDAPDDYYVLYLDGTTSRVLALRYVVSYAPFMKEGMSHTPEKLLVYEDYANHGGLELAGTQTFYAFGDGEKGPRVTRSTISGIEFPSVFDEAQIMVPAGAVIDDALSSAAR